MTSNNVIVFADDTDISGYARQAVYAMKQGVKINWGFAVMQPSPNFLLSKANLTKRQHGSSGGRNKRSCILLVGPGHEARCYSRNICSIMSVAGGHTGINHQIKPDRQSRRRTVGQSPCLQM